MSDANDNKLHNYQDDLDDSPEMEDVITEEETDDPAEELMIPRDELKDELDKIMVDDDGQGAENDDMREAIEDRDEDSRELESNP